jgi:hypothetical protein
METTVIVDLEQFTKEGKVPPHGKHYRVKVNEKEVIFDKQIVTGKKILAKAGFHHPECHWLYQKLKGCDFDKIDLDEKVDLAKPGIEHFTVKPTEVFNYFVDGEPETTDKKSITPNQILEAAGITPVKDYYLVKVNADGSQESFKDTPDVPIKMLCPAVKFVSAFRGETPVS